MEQELRRATNSTCGTKFGSLSVDPRVLLLPLLFVPIAVRRLRFDRYIPGYTIISCYILFVYFAVRHVRRSTAINIPLLLILH